MNDIAHYSLADLRSRVGLKVINLHNGEEGTLTFVSNEYLERDNSFTITWNKSKPWNRFYKTIHNTFGVVFEEEAKKNNYHFDILSFLCYGPQNMSEEQLILLVNDTRWTNSEMRPFAISLLNKIEDNRSWERANTKANRLECKLPGPMPEAQWRKICAEYDMKKIKYE